MTQHTSLKDTVLFILKVFCATFVIQSFLYPDLWFFHTRRLLIYHETLVPLESTFILVSHFFHGGIQLWDRFDQMNNAYFVLANGVYGVTNIIAAFIFIILSPFFTYPSDALYHVHLFFFYGLTCLIRIIGGYLLLRKFVSNKAVLFISLLYLNTILTSYMMTPGILTQGVYSFLPLLMYFILCFFEELRLRIFLLAVLVMTLGFVNSPLFTLGYFYQVVHFFILSCGVAFLLQRGWRRLRGRTPLPRVELFKNMGLAGCCLLIVFPYISWGGALLHDFYVHGSGLGGTQGRFNNIFNLSGYFNIQGKSFANPLEFLGTSLDYQHNVWVASWLFVGGSSLFLALAGLVLSQDRRKYIFAATALSVVLLNTACFPGNFSAFGHYLQYALHNPTQFASEGGHLDVGILYFWLTISSIIHGINALTNPFSFLVRSFQMSSLLVPLLLLPLVAMGLESCLCLWQHREKAVHFKRTWFLLSIYAFIFLWSLAGGTQALSIYNTAPGAGLILREYMLSMAAIFFLLVLLPVLLAVGTTGKLKSRIGWMILACAFAIDLAALTAYVQLRQDFYPDKTVPTWTWSQLHPSAMVPDYQNPRLLPVREFFNVENTSIYPAIDVQQCMYGAFYQYTPLGRFFRPWLIYEPRPETYKNLYPDIEIQEYLKKNPRTIYFADEAFDSRYVRLADILKFNLGSRVIAADQEESNRSFLKTTEKVYIPAVAFKEKFYTVSLGWAKARIHRSPVGYEHIFDLPKDFPSYLSTTVFTDDYRSWKVMTGNRLLSPMQGKLSAPFTYDVQNIQQEKLTVLLPDDKTPPEDLKLQVKLPDRILNVWKNTYDDFGFTYEAPQAGWLVFNYPYDKKWELSVDGQKVFISKVNRYFMGTPIAGGQHRILLRYWPHTQLRFWIFISMVVSVICFFSIIFYSIKREPLTR